MAIRGIQVLRDRGIEHEVLVYRYDRKGTEPAADALGLPHGDVVKSLVFRTDSGGFLFALMAGDATVSVRKLGRATGHKTVEPAAPRDAERLTGYFVGGMSPLGSRQALPVILDETTATRPRLVINAGARGTLVRLATSDLVALIGASIADIRNDERSRHPTT
ncbi:MAG: Cys-tRNA(Pro) deacylase [Candidatus Bipolaricaulota bacterium]|nr:Cys-tRNA(Pro) deacylase [Candidatus Bipolaricaulota bacterium]